MNGSQELKSQGIAQNAKAHIGKRRERSLTWERVRELFDYREDGSLIRKTTVSSNARVGESVGCLGGKGYLQVTVDYRTYYVHRLIWFWHKGYLPEHGVDHKDRIKIHNWIDNLREEGQQCNVRNTGNRVNNISGVKGVHWSSQREKWKAEIMIGGVKINLGGHKDFTEAVALRLAAEQAENWKSCDSSSPAFKFMQNYLNSN